MVQDNESDDEDCSDTQDQDNISENEDSKNTEDQVHFLLLI